jgi:hypothetical protein
MRPFAFALVALAAAAPAFAQSPAAAPDALLPVTTQFYVRWDGIAAHAEAYRKSLWGPAMAGPTGDSVRALLARGTKRLGSAVLAEPLLDGRPPAELKANLADLKAVEKVADLVADRGVIVAAEVREAAPTLKGIGEALGGLIGGKVPGVEALLPDAQLLVVVPDAGDRADVLFGTLRLLLRKAEATVVPLDAGARKGFCVTPAGRGPGRLHAAWWVEGKHFVFYAGTRRPADVIADVAAGAAAGGVTAHPLYKRCRKAGAFESVARGFADTGKVLGLVRSLAGPFVPGLTERLDGVGVAGVRAAVFSSGFDGRESRAVYELDVPGARKGLARVLTNKPLGLADLPPLPPDVSRFAALRLDLAAGYDAGLSLAELLTLDEEFGVEEEAGRANAAAVVKARKEYLAREADKALGMAVADDLLPHLGDKLVVYQSPSEGLQVFGTVVCVSVTDAGKVKKAVERVRQGVEAVANGQVKVRKRVLKGVEYREYHARGLGVTTTPSYALVGDWLVIAGYPQGVQGFILRAAGDLERWRPDAATAARLAKLPADGCGLQFCNPRSTVSNLCTIGPLALSAIGNQNAFDTSAESDFDPIDVTIVPNAHELNRHLFPNLTVTRDDGKTIRIEVNESFSLPLEVIGAEPFAFAALIGLRF